MRGADNHVVQVDDYGQFWDPAPAEAVLRQVRELSATRNVIVVVLVHGWNHNAAPDDGNLVDFAASLEQTRRLLTDATQAQSALYRRSREELTGTEDLTVIGVYIGWRGRSLPGWLNYATFWGRKAAAERVGQGDVREFLYRLNAIYKERAQARRAGQTRVFLGLTAIGHSFGGQVLFKAIAQDVENELIQQAAPGRGPVESLAGFGDLAVLVNPALEALQYERIHRLASRLDLGPRQPPVLLVISSAGDIPRQLLFPAGRHLDTLHRPGFRPGQRELWVKALGESVEQRTHRIEPVPAGSQRPPPFDPALYTSDPCAIVRLDLTDVPFIQGFKLVPTGEHRRHNPFLVAHADIRLVLDHSAVFEPELRLFLNDYIAFTQGKRILLNSPLAGC